MGRSATTAPHMNPSDAGRGAPSRRAIDAHTRARPRRDPGVLAIIRAPAAVHRGYAITIVLDRLGAKERWQGRAIIASVRAPSRWLDILRFEDLTTRREGSRACAQVLRAARERIDQVEDGLSGLWTVIAPSS